MAATDVAESARPSTWWHWFGDTITTNGITHDLEAMKEMGLGGASIYASHWSGLPPGPIKCLSDAWYDHVVWAGKEADRLGLELGFHNCPGWCNTGGPWVRPEYAQKHLVWTETRLDGGKQVDLVLPKAKAPFGIYRPVAVLAIPDREDEVSFAGPLGDFVFDAPRTVSSVVITLPPPGFGPFNHLFLPKPNYVVSVSDDGKTFREHFRTSETCAEAEHTLTFPAVRAKAVRIAKKLWDVRPAKGSARVGKGRVWRGVDAPEVHAAIGLKPDLAIFENGRPADPNAVVYTHRATARGDLYLVANVTDCPRKPKLVFRNGATREISLNGSSSTFVELLSTTIE